jgi:hypothetical protein
LAKGGQRLKNQHCGIVAQSNDDPGVQMCSLLPALTKINIAALLREVPR